MGPLRAANLALRFLLELGALVAFGLYHVLDPTATSRARSA